MNKDILFEGCIDSIEEIDYFISKKIDRLELCDDLFKGGLSPKFEVVKHALKNKIESIVMLREANNFKLSLINFIKIKSKIKKYRSLGVKNYIFGFVKNREIDIRSCKKNNLFVKRKWIICFSHGNWSSKQLWWINKYYYWLRLQLNPYKRWKQ